MFAKSSLFPPFIAIASFAASLTIAYSPSVLNVCTELQQSFPTRFASSLSSAGNLTAAYTEAVGRYWDAANAEDVPACVLFPSTAEEVAKAMQLLAANPSVPFALKSGGHNMNRGFSSTSGGLLITFRPNMNYTKPSSDLTTADVGPGARWAEVMAILDPLNRCAVGGRNSDVGVGGYIPLGGISYLTSEYGFASDNVVNFEVVTANGTLLNANRTSHPDLFWALRGGGNLFGVVTKYTIQIHPIGNVWGGTRTYTSDKAPALFSAITNYISTFNETKSALIPTSAWLGALNGTSIFTIFFFWNGDHPPPHVFSEFLQIPALADTTHTQRYPQLLDMSAVADFTIRTSDAISSLPNLPAKQMREFLDWHFTEANNAPFLHNPTINITLFSMALQPIPVALQAQNARRGPAALTTDPRGGDKLWIEYTLGWQNAVCDETCSQMLISLADAAKVHLQRMYHGVQPTNYRAGDLKVAPYNPLFANDAQAGQPVLKSYGDEAYARLKDVHAMYDPKDVFLLQTQGFQF